MPQQRITQIVLIPDGASWDTWSDGTFRVYVEWMGVGEDGKDRWRVKHGASELSRAGNWAFLPRKFKLNQYRWETMDEALQWARKVTNDVVVNGRTWAQWQEHHGSP